MRLPFEKLISSAIDKITVGVQLKISQIEAERNRDFTQQMKELEFYKCNYEKDLKEIFDYWFEVVGITQLKNNKNLTQKEHENLEEQYNKLLHITNVSKYKMNTLKYGGKETGRILAIENTLHNKKYDHKPKQVVLYVWCLLLAVLKKDILGQDTDAIDIIRVLVNDLYDGNNYDKLLEAKKFVLNVYKDIYNEDPYWK